MSEIKTKIDKLHKVERDMDSVREDIINTAKYNSMSGQSIIALGQKFQRLGVKRCKLEKELGEWDVEFVCPYCKTVDWNPVCHKCGETCVEEYYQVTEKQFGNKPTESNKGERK